MNSRVRIEILMKLRASAPNSLGNLNDIHLCILKWLIQRLKNDWLIRNYEWKLAAFFKFINMISIRKFYLWLCMKNKVKSLLCFLILLASLKIDIWSIKLTLTTCQVHGITTRSYISRENVVTNFNSARCEDGLQALLDQAECFCLLIWWYSDQKHYCDSKLRAVIPPLSILFSSEI